MVAEPSSTSHAARRFRGSTADLSADLLKQDAARPPVARLEPGDVALGITAEDDLAHGQRSREGVPIGLGELDRSETPVADDELPVLDTQVIVCLQLLAEVATREAGQVDRRPCLCDPLPGVVALLMEGEPLRRAIR